MFSVAVHGARGSYPVSGSAFQRYGGHTSCFSIETPSGLLVIDAGSGITALGNGLMNRPKIPPITILFTHFHLDHLIGLPAFKPLLREDAQITLMACAKVFGDWPRIIQTLFQPPYWPVDLAHAKATLTFRSFPETGKASASEASFYGLNIRTCAVRHPQGCVSYRVSDGRHAAVFASDQEHGDAAVDGALIAFAEKADALFYDAQYTPEEYLDHVGWGHSTWESGVRVAERARVKRLVLTSHDPSRPDAAVDAIVADARREFADTTAAQEGEAVRVGSTA